MRLTGRGAPGRSVRDRMTGPGPVGGGGPGGSWRRPVTGSSGAENLGLQVGDDVAHDKFGEGVIISVDGQGDKAEVTVRFRDSGEKRLLLSWAPLRKL